MLPAAAPRQEEVGYHVLQVALPGGLSADRQAALAGGQTQEQNYGRGSMPLTALWVAPRSMLRPAVRSRLLAAPCYHNNLAQGAMADFVCATAGRDRCCGKGPDSRPCEVAILAEARGAEMGIGM